MIYHHCFYCCAIFLLVACNTQMHDNKAFVSPVFPESKQVTVIPFPDDFLLGGSFLMEDMGEFIVIGTKHDNKFLHIFDKETLVHTKSFGTFGQGPGELIGAPKIRVNEDNSVLYLFQHYSGMNDYWVYDVEHLLHDNAVLPARKAKIELFRDEEAQYPGYANDFLAWKDKRLFAGSRMHRLEVQDTLGNTLYLYDKYPTVILSDTTAFQSTYSHSSLALKPDMSRFVIASRVGCIMEIFTIDTSGKIVKEIEKRFHPPIFAVNRRMVELSNGKTIIGITDLSVTDELIYAVYNGNAYTLEAGDFSKKIAVFDWSGNPKLIYILDWKIYDFLVDTQRSRCYLVGIDPNDEVLLGYFEL